jgi:hypothetical protein
VNGLPAKLRSHGSRIAVSLVVIAIAGATCAAAFALGPSDSRGGTQDLFSSAKRAVPGGSLSLRAKALLPGDSAHGTAVVRNDGDAAGRFYLNADQCVDHPGSGGASFAHVLTVTVTDVTGGQHPACVYVGPPVALSGVDLGTFAPGEQRTYRVVVGFPGGEIDAAVFAGCSLELGLRWTAVTPG